MKRSSPSTPSPLWFTDDIIDGLRVILQRRGCKIQQGDILVVEQAVAALCKRAKALVPVVRTCEDCGADIFSRMEPK